ncbi:MAG: hypothetical protein AAFO82_19860 [Bacteroidota bacterium]
MISALNDIQVLQSIRERLKTVDTDNGKLPWHEAVLSMKTITSFEDEVERQGNKKLTFEELYPYIDESDNDYSVDDLLAALN